MMMLESIQIENLDHSLRQAGLALWDFIDGTKIIPAIGKDPQSGAFTYLTSHLIIVHQPSVIAATPNKGKMLVIELPWVGSEFVLPSLLASKIIVKFNLLATEIKLGEKFPEKIRVEEILK